MRFDDLFGNRQTKARVIAEVVNGPLGVEAVENFSKRLLGDAGASVFDHDQHAVFALAHPDADRIAILAEGNCVRYQVHKDLRQTAFKAIYNNLFRRHVGDEFDSLFARIIAKKIADIADHMQQVERLFVLFDQLTVQPRCVRDIGDKAIQSDRVVFDHVHQLYLVVFALGHPQGRHCRPKRGQWVFDLMGDVGRKLFIGIDPVVKGGNHAAQSAGQTANLIRSRSQIGNTDTIRAKAARVLFAPDLGCRGKV